MLNERSDVGMYGLVFAGGGVRGAYEIGVWKALRELKIKAGAVTGTSIGAINAALYAQGAFETAYKLWRGIGLRDIIALPESQEMGDNLFDIKNLVRLSEELRKNEGFDMSPLKKLLTEVIDEKKLRKSAVDFGCAAFSVSGKGETRVFKEDIPEGKLVDYLMASASILGIKEIDGERFTDGGIANNMPVDMLTERGYTDIIAVDVRGVGVYKNVNTSGCNIINIKCAEPATGIMDFSAEGIEKSITMGFLDGMKAFGVLYGAKYYIKRDGKTLLSRELTEGLEQAAEAFGVDPLRAYTLDELALKTLEEYEKAEDSGVISWLVEKIEEDGSRFLKNGLEILSSNYNAASAILYFKRKLR